jgi:hypothetical protein
MWIKPPMAVDVTSPRSHKTIRTTAIVYSMAFTFSIDQSRRFRADVLPRTTRCRTDLDGAPIAQRKACCVAAPVET